MLVAIDVLGLVFRLYVGLNAGSGSGSPSSLRFLTIAFSGLGLYSGYGLIVHLNPLLGGFDGLNGVSCTTGGLGTTGLGF